MQALKDAGIVLVLVMLAFSVRITPIDPSDAPDGTLLAPPAEAATSADGQVLPAATGVVDRCTEFVLELNEGAEPMVVVLETVEDEQGTPCPRT